jgi:hypothetical protein
MDFTARVLRGPDQAEVLLRDALLSAQRALKTVPVSSHDTAALDLLEERCRIDMVDATLGVIRSGIALTAGVAASILLLQLVCWHEGGAYSFDNFVAAFGAKIRSADDGLLDAIVDLLDRLKNGHEAGIRDSAMASAAFGRVADLLDRKGAPSAALACALTALSLIPGLEMNVLEEPLARALVLARREGHRDAIGFCLARSAAAWLVKGSREARLKAFDRLQELVRNPPVAASFRQLAMQLLAGLLNETPGVDNLKSLVVCALMPAGDVAKTVRPNGLDLLPFLSTEWTLPTLGELEEKFAELKDFLSDVEDERVALTPPSSDTQAEAKWIDYSFTHPVLQRSIPMGQSFRILPEHDETLLAIHHELTHVMSFRSHIGNSVVAIRAALLETELDLWALLVSQGKEKTATEVFSRGLAPLSALDGDVVALAHAERGIALAQKLAVLQETWAGWFEGLAVFAELHGDSTLDDSLSEMGMVATQLEDNNIQAKALASSIDPIVLLQEHQRQAERLYSVAAREVGPYALRTYLERYPSKYLAGYFSVRAVVAAWRRRNPASLNGSRALRALLHVTRFGSGDAIPNLGLPAEGFRAAACSQMRQWLGTIAAIPSEDLEQLLSSFDLEQDESADVFGWREGRLFRRGENETSPHETFDRQFTEALSTMAAPHADPTRLGALSATWEDELLKGLLEQCANSLADYAKSPRRGSRFEIMDQLLARYLILSIAETTAPFWINVTTNTLVVIPRTGKNRSGTSRFGFLRLPLYAESCRELLAEARRTGVARLTISRIADLAGFHGETRARARVGSNYLVLRLGTWMHVMPAGVLFGTPDAPEGLVELIRARYFPNPVASMEEGVTSLGVRCAQRTIDWIDSVQAWGTEEDELPLGRWAAHVRASAFRAVQANGTDSEQATNCQRALLSFVFGDEVLENTLVQTGFALGMEDRSWVGRALGLLVSSGTRPVPTDAMQAGNIPQRVVDAYFQCDNGTWDVRPPADPTGA